MKKSILFLLVAMALTITTASAQNVKYHGEVFVTGSGAKGNAHLSLFGENASGEGIMYGASLQTIQGAKFGDYFSLGVGFGLDFLFGYEPAKRRLELGTILIPIYADLKLWIPTKSIVTPYIMGEAGGSFAIHPLTIQPLYGAGVGMKIGALFTVSLNYIYDGFGLPKSISDVTDLSYHEHKIQLRLGLTF